MKADGPLPKDDANAKLQRRSLAVFNERVSQDKFIVRQETVSDYGVDLGVEAVLGDHPLNYRGQIQLKGRSGLTPNSQKCFALSVETSNLNYLLNGECPFYVLFRPEDETLWYVSARGEEARLKAENPSWRQQKSVTLYLRNQLDDAGFTGLYDVVVHNGRVAAELLSILHSMTPGSPGKFSVDVASARIETEASAFDAILTNGMLLIAAGEAERVLELSSLLSSADQRHPEIAIALAYAQYSRGRHKNAEVVLADLDLTTLSSENRGFAEFLALAAEAASGRVSPEEFATKVEAWADGAPFSEQVQYRLLAQHRRANGMTGYERRQELAQLHEMASLAANNDRLPALVRAFATRYRLEVESERIAGDLTKFLLFSGTRKPIQNYVFGGRSLEEVVDASIRRIIEWEKSIDSLVQFAVESGHQPLRCGVLYTREVGRAVLLVSLSNAASHAPNDELKTTLSFDALLGASGTAARLHDLISLSKKLNETGLYLLSSMLLLRLLDRADAAETKVKAIRLAREATLHGLPNIADEASEIASGRSFYLRLQEQKALEDAMDPDSKWAAMTEDGVAGLARGLCESLRLPEDRIPVAIEEIQANRFFALRRLDWCKHVEFLENKFHTASPATYYRTSPNKKVRCRLFGTESAFPNPDASTIFNAFQGAHCRRCSHRAPSQEARNSNGRDG